MSVRGAALWLVAAVVGLALATAITLAASQLSNQQVGLSGEPIGVGSDLAPRTTATIPYRTRPKHPSHPSQGRPASPSPAPAPIASGDDGAGDD